jgi:hypothetical protein
LTCAPAVGPDWSVTVRPRVEGGPDMPTSGLPTRRPLCSARACAPLRDRQIGDSPVVGFGDAPHCQRPVRKTELRSEMNHDIGLFRQFHAAVGFKAESDGPPLCTARPNAPLWRPNETGCASTVLDLGRAECVRISRPAHPRPSAAHSVDPASAVMRTSVHSQPAADAGNSVPARSVARQQDSAGPTLAKVVNVCNMLHGPGGLARTSE